MRRLLTVNITASQSYVSVYDVGFQPLTQLLHIDTVVICLSCQDSSVAVVRCQVTDVVLANVV